MAFQVENKSSPPATGESAKMSPSHEGPISIKPFHQEREKPIPPPPGGDYFVLIPRDQILRYPQPENARLLEEYTGMKSRRRNLGRCLRWTLGPLFLIAILIIITSGVLGSRVKLPKYSVDDIAIRGFNVTTFTSISPEFDVIIVAKNPNNKIDIYYQKGGSIKVDYSTVHLGEGALPAFCQSPNNLIVFQTELQGPGILLSRGVRSALVDEEKKGKVLLGVNLLFHVDIKFRSSMILLWKTALKVKVKCAVAVDKLTQTSKIVSTECNSRWKIL